jgi:hypothetical protein
MRVRDGMKEKVDRHPVAVQSALAGLSQSYYSQSLPRWATV